MTQPGGLNQEQLSGTPVLLSLGAQHPARSGQEKAVWLVGPRACDSPVPTSAASAFARPPVPGRREGRRSHGAPWRPSSPSQLPGAVSASPVPLPLARRLFSLSLRGNVNLTASATLLHLCGPVSLQKQNQRQPRGWEFRGRPLSPRGSPCALRAFTEHDGPPLGNTSSLPPVSAGSGFLSRKVAGRAQRL